jgi:hypothetical protein
MLSCLESHHGKQHNICSGGENSILKTIQEFHPTSEKVEQYLPCDAARSILGRNPCCTHAGENSKRLLGSSKLVIPNQTIVAAYPTLLPREKGARFKVPLPRERDLG